MKESNFNQPSSMLARGGFVNGALGERMSKRVRKRTISNKAVFAVVASLAMIATALFVVNLEQTSVNVTKNEGKGANAAGERANDGIDIYPAYIANDTATPFAVHYSISNLVPNTNYYSKLRLRNATTLLYVNQLNTYNYGANTWTNDGTAWTACNVIHTDAAGNVAGWLVGRVFGTTLPAGPYDIVLRIRLSANYDCTDIASNIRLLNMTTEGCWLTGFVYEPDGTTPMENASVLVKSGTTVIGTYMSENNGVNEGYTNGSGYYRVAVPIGTNYVVEVTNQASTFKASLSSVDASIPAINVTLPNIVAYSIPEFSELVLPIVGVIAVVALVGYRRRKK